MTISTGTPTTRKLALVALILAAGVFSLRASTLFSPRIDAPIPGSQTERTLTDLLEAVSGENNVRVSVQAGLSKSALIVVNETAVSDAQLGEIETLTRAALKLDPDTDTLTLTRLAFATSPATLTQIELLELFGLGLVSLLIAGALLAPAATPTQNTEHPNLRPSGQSPNLRVMDAHTLSPANEQIERASLLAETDPDGTAKLLRRWMNDDKARQA